MENHVLTMACHHADGIGVRVGQRDGGRFGEQRGPSAMLPVGVWAPCGWDCQGSFEALQELLHHDSDTQ